MTLKQENSYKKIMIRTSEEKKSWLTRKAKKLEMSVNQFLNYLINKAMGEKK